MQKLRQAPFMLFFLGKCRIWALIVEKFSHFGHAYTGSTGLVGRFFWLNPMVRKNNSVSKQRNVQKTSSSHVKNQSLFLNLVLLPFWFYQSSRAEKHIGCWTALSKQIVTCHISSFLMPFIIFAFFSSFLLRIYAFCDILKMLRGTQSNPGKYWKCGRRTHVHFKEGSVKVWNGLKNGLRKDVGSWNWRGWISFGTFMADQVGNYSLPLIITRIHQKRLKRRQLEFWTNLRQWSWVTKKSWKSPKKVKSLPLCTSQGISAPSPAWRALSPGLVGLQLIFVGPVRSGSVRKSDGNITILFLNRQWNQAREHSPSAWFHFFMLWQNHRHLRRCPVSCIQRHPNA